MQRSIETAAAARLLHLDRSDGAQPNQERSRGMFRKAWSPQDAATRHPGVPAGRNRYGKLQPQGPQTRRSQRPRPQWPWPSRAPPRLCRRCWHPLMYRTCSCPLRPLLHHARRPRYSSGTVYRGALYAEVSLESSRESRVSVNAEIVPNRARHAIAHCHHVRAWRRWGQGRSWMALPQNLTPFSFDARRGGCVE